MTHSLTYPLTISLFLSHTHARVIATLGSHRAKLKGGDKLGHYLVYTVQPQQEAWRTRLWHIREPQTFWKAVTKREPLLVYQHEESIECSIVRIEKKLRKRRDLQSRFLQVDLCLMFIHHLHEVLFQFNCLQQLEVCFGRGVRTKAGWRRVRKNHSPL